mgnify:CR=1 FL=1
MIQIYVNCWAVLAGAIANMGLGFVWYGPLFGKQWVAMMGWSKEAMEKGRAKMQKEGWKTYLPAFVGSLLTSFVLSYGVLFVSNFFVTTGISVGLMTGFWAWLGFVVPVTLSTVLWEGKSWNLWFLNASYYLFSLLIIGAIVPAFE